MVFVELCQFCSLLHSVVQTTKFVYQLDIQSIRSQPYTSLSDRVNHGGLYATTFRYDVEEVLIALVDIGLHVLHDLIGILAQNKVGLIVGKLVGGHTVESYTEFVGNESAEVRNQSEDTDATCNRCWLSENVVGRRTDPVTS